MTVAATAAPTPVPPTVPPAVEPTPVPTLPPPPPATAVPQDETLAILSFTVETVDIGVGKRLTFNWQTTGAIRATIFSGTSRRFPQGWEVEPNGTLTIELAETGYRNPQMFLVAYDAQGEQVSEFVTVGWPCTYDYFFPTDLEACPLYEASVTQAAEQSFENGRMIWLEEIQGDSFVQQRLILVFYGGGSYAQYEDTWTEDQPESDPALVPPGGLLQPIRGFGKLWRENPDVRDQLGWAIAPEQGFESTWQQQFRESIPSVAFVRTLDGQIIQIDGWGWETGGSWRTIAP